MTDQIETTTTFALPPDFPDRATFEAEWCAELRSGKRKQGRSRLHYNDLWCCLGVACDVAVKHGVGHWEDEQYISPDGEARGGFLPRWLCDHLARNKRGAPVKAREQSFSYLNDNGVPFVTIAGVIEGSVTYADAHEAAAAKP